MCCRAASAWQADRPNETNKGSRVLPLFLSGGEMKYAKTWSVVLLGSLGCLAGSNPAWSAARPDESIFLAGWSGGANELKVSSAAAAAWTLRYPTLFSSRSAGDGAWGDALRAYEDGRLLEAMIAFDQVPAEARNADYYVYWAHFQLLIGGEAEARSGLSKAMAMAPEHAGALALRAIMALREDRSGAALVHAGQAVARNPKLPAAHLASSYAHQANRDLAAARASAEEVIRLEPGNALAHLRLAELDLASGEVAMARKRAEGAVALAPRLADARNVLGFVLLGQDQADAAAEAFKLATRLNALEPAGHFGLGLAYVRLGQLEAGREQLEAATKLAPGSALPHTYLGRAYEFQGRDREAAEQYALAVAADPLDPTPYRFEALRLARNHAPVSAGQALRSALHRVDNRAVYRGPNLLARDRALHLADMASLDGELGMADQAGLEAARAVSEDYASGAAHRAAGDALARIPRAGIAKQGEYLHALLRSPLGSLPPPLALAEGMQPGAVAPQQGFFSPAAPERTGYNEFGAVFNTVGPKFDLGLTAGGRASLGDQVRAASVAGKLGWSISQLYFRTDGFGDYDGMEQSYWRGVLQYDPGPDTRWHLEYQVGDGERKGVLFPDDPIFSLPQAVDEQRDRVRLALRNRLGAGDLTLLASREYLIQGIDNQPTPGNFRVDAQHDRQKVRGDVLEAQYLYQASAARLIAGLAYSNMMQRYSNGEGHYLFDFPPDPPFALTIPESTSVKHAHTLTAYAYGQYRPSDDLELGIGLAADNQDFFGFRQHFLSPKLSLSWQPVPGGTLRMAALRGLGRFFVDGSSLEPAQFGGFRVFANEALGMRTDLLGLGWEQRLAADWDWGFEWSQRKNRQPLPGYPDQWRERNNRVWLSRALSQEALPAGWEGAVVLAYDGQNYERHAVTTGLEQIRDYRPRHLRLGGKLFSADGWGLDLGLTWVRTDGVQEDVFGSQRALDDAFPILDASLNWALPRRLGQLSIGAMNLFDQKFRYLEMDPANPRFAPERYIYARLHLAL